MRRLGRVDSLALSEDEASALLEEHYGLCHKLAQRFTPHGSQHLEFEEALAIAQTSLLIAYKDYDASQAKFSTWAHRIITQDLYYALRKARGNSSRDVSAILKLRRYERGQGEAPSERDMAAIERAKRRVTLSLDAPIHFEDKPLGAAVGGPDARFDDIERRDLRQWLREAIERVLDEKERTVAVRMLEGVLGPAIADELGVSRQRVDQIRRRAFAKIVGAAGRELLPSHAPRLTKAEWAVVRAISQGASRTEAAKMYDLSPEDVDARMDSARAKIAHVLDICSG